MISGIINSAKPALLLRPLTRVQLGHELSPSPVPRKEYSKPWLVVISCPGHATMRKNERCWGSCMAVYLCDCICGAGYNFCGDLIQNTLPVVVIIIWMSVNQDEMSS